LYDSISTKRRNYSMYNYHKCLIFWINFLKKYSPVQLLLFYVWIFCQHFPHVCNNNPNFSSIHVAYSKIGLNTPMGSPGVIPYYRYCKLMVRNVYRFSIITSNNCWRPPTNMLKSNHFKLVK